MNAGRPVFHSRSGQDRWVVEEVFPGRRGGFFVDVGAFDGVHASNTFALERDFGWSGICVEANPWRFAKARRKRSCDCVLACLDAERSWGKFRLAGECSGLVAEDTDQNREARPEKLREAEEKRQLFDLPTVTLTELLEHMGAPAEMQYLSIDVEGAEDRVIDGLDFGRFQFACLSMERPSERVNEVLSRNGYAFVKLLNQDSCYVRPELAPDTPVENVEFTKWPAWEMIGGVNKRIAK